jgi:uncharacterized protein YndB with AHSA1/START domain
MGRITVAEERLVDAPADTVYRCIADMHEHPKFLPDNFSDFEIEQGGVGAGTVTTFSVKAGGRTRNYRMTVSEPEPGRVLRETDADSSLVTTFTVNPTDSRCRVRIETSWDGAGGIGGVFERLFAPMAMRKIYADELARLERHARQLG